MKIDYKQIFPFTKDIFIYQLNDFRKDLLAALLVAMMIVPQSIAYSLLAGLPPISGFYSAIFGTIFVGFFCKSKHLFSGPSTAVAILLQVTIQDILYTFYPNISAFEKESVIFHILLQLIVVIGIVQVLLSFLHVGKLLQFVSRSVILGYFTGLGISILISQCFPMTGISLNEESNTLLFQLMYLVRHLSEVNFISFLLGISGLGILFFIKRHTSIFPDGLIMLLILSFCSFFMNKNLLDGDTIHTLEKFGTFSFIPKISMPNIDLGWMQKIVPSALAIAFLSIFEVFSVSRFISSKNGENLSVNQEVCSVGIANLFLSIFPGAMPASASISRSNLGYRAKASSHFSLFFTGLLTWAIIAFLWPFAKHIPLPAISALLIFSIFYILDFEQIKLCFRTTKEDSIVFLATLTTCFVFTLDVAFLFGIIISIITYLRKAAIPHFVEYAFNTAGRLTVISVKEYKHRKIRIIGIGGELFFGMVDILQNTLQKIAEDTSVQVIILRLHGVHYMDASMCLAINRLHAYLQSTNRYLVISGLTEDVWKVLMRSQLLMKIGKDNLFLTDEARPQFSTWKACLRAEELLS